MRLSPLAAGLVIASSLHAASAHAQRCEGNDALLASRRARRVLEDVRAANADVDRDVYRMQDTQRLAPDGEARTWTYAAGTGEVDTFGSFEVCSTSGRLPGALLRGRGGVVVGHDAGPVGLRAHWSTSTDQITVHDPAGSARAGETPRSGSLAFVQDSYGGTLTLARWVRAEMAYIREHAPLSSASERSGVRIVDATEARSASSRVAAALSIPALGLSSEALTNITTGEIELASVRSTRVPLGRTGVLVTAGSTYFADEKQVATLGGVTYRRFEAPVVRTPERMVREGSGWEIGAEASGEHGSGRLRHGRVRFDAFVNGDRALARPLRHGPTYLTAGVFAEATSFGSASFRARTGRSHVLGGGGGAYAGFGLRIMTLRLEAYGGANRPEALARVSELATRGEFRGTLYARFGY